MPANYTRRHDLFIDSGFSDPDGACRALSHHARAFGLLTDGGMSPDLLSKLFTHIDDVVSHQLPRPLRKLLDRSLEWMFERGGDLATFLWMAKTVAEDADEDVRRSIAVADQNSLIGQLILALIARCYKSGRCNEASAILRFMVALDFDFGDLYHDSSIAYGFFEPRDPNPLVWKLFEFVEDRNNRGRVKLDTLSILDLGCGIGNDALGFLSYPRTKSYCGIDVGEKALAEHYNRVKSVLTARTDVIHRLEQTDFVNVLRNLSKSNDMSVNLVYSYSSLHYFSSSEIAEIFDLVRRTLLPTSGLFSFAIKGKGSVWDGKGVPIYRPDVWINHDGQSRWFPARSALVTMVDRLGFELLTHEWHEHWGYSEKGRRDNFHYVICTPRP
ncbi:MAG: class I SAM-dependent methyltransferase [Myxococcales bacterium]|nr:class I SAM-dependent methyltransferase [Myxococcales bacterium]